MLACHAGGPGSIPGRCILSTIVLDPRLININFEILILRDRQSVWADILNETLSKYIFTMKSRCEAVILAKGGHTRF